MERIRNYGMLQQAIQTLETEQDVKWQQLKAQFRSSNKGFIPSGLLNNAFMGMVTSPYLINKTVGTALGLASGYLLEKVVVGVTTALFRKLFLNALRVGATTLFKKRREAVKSP